MKFSRKAPQDLKTALGQCFWIGLNGTTVDDPETREIFQRFQPGGIILFQRNVESIEQVQALNSRLQENSNIPLLIAIDQEGGTVERLPLLIGTIPPAIALSAAHSGRLIRKIHSAHARLLSALGFNVNFTPVLDLALANADNGLGTRCFSDDPRVVVRCARVVIEAHFKAGVLICGKHFPGLGDTDTDSHLALPTVPRPWKQIEKEDLKPYRKLLNDLPFIMINHALYPEKNKELPASLAPEITKEFLLKKWRYGGLAISDDLIMGAVSNLYNLPEAAERALLAGNQMFLICKPEGVVKAYERLLSRAKRDSALEKAIFRSSSRILAFKFQRLKSPSGSVNIKREIELMGKYSARASEKAITFLRGEPLEHVPDRCTLFLAQTKWISGDGNKLEEFFSSKGASVSAHYFPVRMEEPEAKNLACLSKTDWNFIVTSGMSLNSGQRALLQRLLEQGKSVALISGAFPLDPLPQEVKVAVAAYWTAPAALEAAAKVLFGERKATGKLPLRRIPR